MLPLGRMRELAVAMAIAVGPVAADFCHMFYVNADTNLEDAQLGYMDEVLTVDNDYSFTGLLYMDRNDGDTSRTSKAMEYLLDENGHQSDDEGDPDINLGKDGKSGRCSVLGASKCVENLEDIYARARHHVGTHSGSVCNMGSDAVFALAKEDFVFQHAWRWRFWYLRR